MALVEVEGGVWELDGRRKGGAKFVCSIFTGLNILGFLWSFRWVSASLGSSWARQLQCARSTWLETQPA